MPVPSLPPPTDTDNEAAAWASLGDTLVRQGRREDALAAFEQSLALAPGNADCAKAVAVLLAGLQCPGAALEVLRKLTETADILVMEAILLLDLGDARASLAHCDRALQLHHNHFAALLNRGVALRSQGRIDEVVTNDTRLSRAYIGNAVAQYNLGDALLAAGHYGAALTALDRSLKLAPQHVPARMARALALAMLQRFSESAAAFAAAERQDAAAASNYLEQAARGAGLPAGASLSTEPRAIYLTWSAMAASRCDWRERAHLEQVLEEFSRRPPAQDRFEAALAYNALVLDLSHEAQQAIARRVAVAAAAKARDWGIGNAAAAPGREAAGRLRVGYLTPDCRDHPVARIFWRLLQLHDRDRFEAITYSLHPGDDSQERLLIERGSDQFIDVSRRKPWEVAERIAADGIHLLVDLAGYTDFSRPEILAARPAPVQVQLVGWPGPMGAEFIDYRFADKIVCPADEAARWDEHLVMLPETLFICNDTQAIAPPPSRADCGLPDDGFVFCCFNSHHKIDPAAFGIWMGLLRRLPGSVLWLTEGGAASQANLLAEAKQRGVAAARLVFAPRQPMSEHLGRHACADLFLDTFNYNAHTTASDALWAGLPVLTCRGRTMAGRMGASIVSAAGLADLVAKSHQEYETLALHLATNPEQLAAVRGRLKHSRMAAPLFQTESRVRAIERAYERMWVRHAAGLPPESFEVTS